MTSRTGDDREPSAALREALAATRADLATLRDPPVPPEVSAQWARALHAAATAPAAPETLADGRTEPRPATPLPQHRPPTRSPRAIRPGGPPAAVTRPPGPHRRRPRPALLTAAVLAVVAAIAVLWPTRGRDGGEPAADVSADTAVTLAAAALDADRPGPYGADPTRLAECLGAVDPTTPTTGPLIAEAAVTVAGQPADVLVLPGPRLGAFRIVVVAAGCGTAQGSSLLRAVTWAP